MAKAYANNPVHRMASAQNQDKGTNFIPKFVNMLGSEDRQKSKPHPQQPTFIDSIKKESQRKAQPTPDQPVILEKPKEEDDGGKELPPQAKVKKIHSMERNLSFMPDRPQETEDPSQELGVKLSKEVDPKKEEKEN